MGSAQSMEAAAAAAVAAVPSLSAVSNAATAGSVVPAASRIQTGPGGGGAGGAVSMNDTHILPSASAPELPTARDPSNADFQPAPAVATAPRVSSTLHNPPMLPSPLQTNSQKGVATGRPERLNLDLVGQLPSAAATPAGTLADPTMTSTAAPALTSTSAPDTLRCPTRGAPHIWRSPEQREHTRSVCLTEMNLQQGYSYTAPLQHLTAPVKAPHPPCDGTQSKPAALAGSIWVQPAKAAQLGSHAKPLADVIGPPPPLQPLSGSGLFPADSATPAPNSAVARQIEPPASAAIGSTQLAPR